MIAASRARLILIAILLSALALCAPALAGGLTIPEAKQLGNGASIQLSAKIVTYAASGFFYVQEVNRGMSEPDSPVGGIRVLKNAHGLAVGARVDLSGTMRMNDKLERYIECTTVASATGTGTVVPWMMSNRAVDEPNNTGLLVTTTGFVGYVDPAGVFAYIDDGLHLSDGNALGALGDTIPGLRVIISGGCPLPKAASYVSATGTSSFEAVAGSPARAILAQTIVRADPWTPISDIDMTRVPGGSFLMGNSGEGEDASGYPREYPQHTVDVPTFWISKTEVTRGQYRLFVNAGGYGISAYWSAAGWTWRLSIGRTAPDYWADAANWGEPFGSFSQGDSRPVVGVSYYEAEAFCNWAGGRLPSEAEWEKAARWDGTPRVYPWGNVADKSRCNDWYDTAYPGFQTSPVGSRGVSIPYGCSDMAGNAWEWTQDWYKSYPGSANPFDKTGVAKALRGGSYYGAYGDRCACRWFAAPGYTDNDVGFRIAR